MQVVDTCIACSDLNYWRSYNKHGDAQIEGTNSILRGALL